MADIYTDEMGFKSQGFLQHLLVAGWVLSIFYGFLYSCSVVCTSMGPYSLPNQDMVISVMNRVVQVYSS